MLPQYGSPDDALALIRYLKPKPTGATTAEARKALGGSAVDSRKLAAFDFWGLIDTEGDRLTLTTAGREVARDEGTLAEALATCLRATPAYHSALEWAFYQELSALDTYELGAYWHEHFSSALGTESEKSISRACSTFMRVAAATGLGTYVLGRKGQPTRLDIDRDALGSFVRHEALTHGASESRGEPVDADDEPGEETTSASTESSTTPGDGLPDVTSGGETETGELRVFVSHGKNLDLVDQVSTMLEVADVPFEIAVKEESPAIPVPQKVLASMRRCNAGVVIVSVDDEEADSFTVNENVLIEIGAAFVLYDQRVVLVWDKRLPVPSNLQGLYRCEFEGSELSWGSGMKLMKAVKGFVP